MQTLSPGARVQLHITLLGRLEARTDADRRIRLPGRHAQALFALLALTRRPRSREVIAADLWPVAGSGSAGSLRQALWLIRQGLSEAGIGPDSVLDIDAETVGIRPEAHLVLDIETFESSLNDADTDTAAALAFYHGDLLEGLGHDCFAAERERLSDRFEDALATVADERLAASDPAAARQFAERLLDRDPLREEAHAVLIAVQGLLGTRSQVVRQYRHLRDILERELDEAPLPDTEAIYRQALDRTMQRAIDRAAHLEPERPPVLTVVG